MTSQDVLLAGCIMPHPPVIVPGVEHGRMKAEQTVAAMKQLAREVAALRPDTLVLISPHAPLFSDYLFIYDDNPVEGSLSAFGVPEISLTLELDVLLRDRFIEKCTGLDISAGSLDASAMRRFDLDKHLDHGAFVPLYFLQRVWACPVLVLSSPAMPMEDLYALGAMLRRSAAELGRRIVIIASGDQSHKVNDNSPYGSCPEGAQYDKRLVQALNNSDRVAILAMDPVMRKNAAECGYRSIVMLCGAFNDVAVRSDVLSYEAPYGIGYCVASVLPDPLLAKPAIDPLQAAQIQLRRSIKHQQATASAPVRIAHETIERYIRHRQVTDSAHFQRLMAQETWLKQKAGVFVSLKKQGELRGCIGTTEATTDSVTEEIIRNAISAATRDPRFPPVDADELPDLMISVDVLQTPVPVASPEELDPKKYGVIVRSGPRTGLLLPDLEGIDRVDEQLSIAKSKAGIGPDEPCSLEKFTVVRYL